MRRGSYDVVAIVSVAFVLTAILLGVAFRPPESAEPNTYLTRCPTFDLLQQPRTEEVCQELLRRGDIDPKALSAALTRLARLQEMSKTDVLFRILEDHNYGTTDHHLQNLCSLFASEIPLSTYADLRLRVAALTSSKSPQMRRFAWATLISLDRSAVAVVDLAESNEQKKDLLTGLQLVHFPVVSTDLYNEIRPWVLRQHSTDDIAVQKAAITASALIPGREKDIATDLVQLVDDQRITGIVIRALARLPSETWPAVSHEQLARIVVAFIAVNSVDNRDSESVEAAFTIGNHLVQMFSDQKKVRLQRRLEELSTDWRTIVGHEANR